eukprot:scaffold664_cov238-Chaetoceros_neogracile.AAC.1
MPSQLRGDKRASLSISSRILCDNANNKLLPTQTTREILENCYEQQQQQQFIKKQYYGTTV